ncbi:MAG: TonB-dependent receptor [Candidatus Marinimicrobia bacterium]|nr:TonB-dependent receptor [Candidatus Neomarinimicrobiota bacterium]
MLSFALSKGNTSRISGYLSDVETGEPIMYANIILVNTVVGTASDNSGYFVITDIPPGTYTLKIMMMGYKSIEKTITLESEDDKRYDFELNTSILKGEEVTVTAERQRFEKKVEVSRVNLTLRDIKTAPAFVETDVFRSLQLLPGVNAANDFSSALVVRGGSPDENLILLDGIEVYNPYHLGGVFSTFSAEAISDAEFLIGGFPAQYGNRISSVLKVTSKEGNSKRGLLFNKQGPGRYWDVSQIQGEVSILSTKILAEGPIKNGSWMWSIRRTYFDQLAKLYYWSKDEPMDWKYYFWDSQGKLIYDISPKSRLTFSTFYGRDAVAFNLGEEYKNEVDFKWDWGNATNSLQWRYVPNSQFLSTLSIANTNYQFDLNVAMTNQDTVEGTTKITIDVFNEINDWTIKEKLDWFVSSEHTVTAGLELKNLRMNFTQQFNDIVMLDQGQNPYILSSYIQDKWQPTVRLTIQPGLRISKYSLHDKIYYEPRFGFKYLLTDDLALKGAYGIYKQFLFTVNDEDDILNIVDFWQPILENYSAKSLQQYILGVEQWIGKNWYASLEGYYKPYDNTLTLNPNNNPSIDDDDYIEGDGTTYGFEILLKKSSGTLTGWVGYSYLNSEQRYDFNSDGEIVEESGEIYSPKYDQPHTLNIVANYSLNDKNSIGFTLSNSNGKPYTPTVGYTYTQNLSGIGMSSTENPYSNLVELEGLRNSARYPSYFRIDMSWMRQIHPFGLDGKFKLQIINITNHFNTFLYNWNLEEDIVTAVGMFPILPTIGFEFKF